MATIAAKDAAIWAAAGADRFASCIRRTQRGGSTEEEADSLVGDALLALIALDLTLNATRWLVANRDDARTGLGPLGDDLDLIWWIVRKRRNRIAHTRGWLAQVGEGYIVVSRRGIEISGYPTWSFVTGSYWCGQVRAMLHGLVWPLDDDRPHVEPAEVDETDMPAWARTKPEDWEPHLPSQPLYGPPSPPV